MGDGCQPKNLVAITRAGNQIQGDIFSEAERVKNFSGEQRFHYEKVMANHFGIKPKGKTASAWDAIKKTKGEKNPLMDGRNYDRPSVMFSKKFYGSIDSKLKAWAKGKDTSLESYKENIGKPIKTVIEAIDSEVKSAKTMA